MSALDTTPEARFAAYDSHFSLYKMTGDVEHLRAMFHLLDLDGDNRASKSEILQYYSCHEPANRAQEMTRTVFALADTNKDGSLDEGEFVSWCQQLATFELGEIDTSQRATAQEMAEIDRALTRFQDTQDNKYLENIFRLVDQNHDGVISSAELRASALCKAFKSPDFAATFLMKLGDTNDDGVLNLPEFIELMNACVAGLAS